MFSPITREEALEEMKHDPYPTEEMMKTDKEYVLKKLGLTEDEFEVIISLPLKTFRDYPSNYWLFQVMIKLRNISRRLKFLNFC